MIKKGIPLILLILLLLHSCAGEPPEIIQTLGQRNFVKDPITGNITEYFSLLIQANDSDGLEDLVEIYLIQDEEEIFFRIDSENWIKKEKDGEFWLGSNGFTMPDRRSIPSGLYRVLLLDKSGERDEKEIYLFPAETKGIKFPSVRISEETISISDSQEALLLLVYDSVNNFLGSQDLGTNPLPLSSLPGGLGKASYLYLYRYKDKENYGILSGPIYIPSGGS